MALRCRLGRHQGAGQGIWNDGLFFGQCTRCATPLIRRPDQPWNEVPAGYVVIWSEGRPPVSAAA